MDTRSTFLKTVSISSSDMKRIVVNDVPYLRKLVIDANTVQYLEVHFEKRLNHVKPFEFIGPTTLSSLMSVLW